MAFFNLVFLISAWLAQNMEIGFSRAASLILIFNNVEYPLFLGVGSTGLVCLILCLFAVHMVNEFFGKKGAYFLCLAGGVALVLIWVLLQVGSGIYLIDYVRGITSDGQALLDFGKRKFLGLVSAVIFGFGFVSLVFHWVRGWTHSHLAFLRILLSHLAGFFVVVGFLSFPHVYPTFNVALFLIFFVTTYLQLIVFTFIFIPFFYFFRVIVSWIVGRAFYEETLKMFAKPQLFVHKEPDFFEVREENQQARI